MVNKDKITGDIRTLSRFIFLYCRNQHPARDKAVPRISGIAIPYRAFLTDAVCAECGRALLYGLVKRIQCRMNPKPSCRNCPNICFNESHRQYMRQVMRHAGKHYLRNPLTAIPYLVQYLINRFTKTYR